MVTMVCCRPWETVSLGVNSLGVSERWDDRAGHLPSLGPVSLSGKCMRVVHPVSAVLAEQVALCVDVLLSSDPHGLSHVFTHSSLPP